MDSRLAASDRAPGLGLGAEHRVALCLAFLAVQGPAPVIEVDLDADGATDRRIVVDREAGQYLGHPTTLLLEDGRTILAVYPKGHGKGAIVYKRSTDGGLTWSERLPTPASWVTSLETPTLHRAVDAAGAERVLLFSGLHPIRMAVSEDDGASFGELRPVGDWGGSVAMSGFTRLSSGDYLAFFHDDGSFLRAGGAGSDTYRTFQTRSRDGGLTWNEPREILATQDVHLCEPGCVRSPDGRELTLLLRENRRQKNSFAMTSRDEGESWGEPFELSWSLTGDRHVAKYAPDGRLVVTFRDRAKGRSTYGDWVAWVGRYEDIASRAEGQYRVLLQRNNDGNDCGYAGLELFPDGTFVAVSYGHWSGGQQPYVIAVRFRLEEIDALAQRGAR